MPMPLFMVAAITVYLFLSGWYWGEAGAISAQNMQVGPCIPVGIPR
jgi:hypothetical protein